ncbi:hypothetical protein BC827DRAFT_1187008 [Russula dissimulans]|nr:hypothetical protein BC827DRAFT_1252807 [Russula dissimulans]KAH9965014.1 hypothetical protein BC827DRAFT_1187008 [Russula dissimulans]
MENLWPQQRQQNDHLPPISSNDPRPVAQWQIPTRSDTNVFQGCSCWWCSVTRRGDAPAREYQDTWLPGGGDLANPGANRDFGVNNPTGIAPIVNDQTQAPFVAPHAVNQENEVLDISVREGLRRLAGRYVNNPESFVNTVRLELSPSGRLQVVIVIDIGNIL